MEAEKKLKENRKGADEYRECRRSLRGFEISVKSKNFPCMESEWEVSPERGLCMYLE